MSFMAAGCETSLESLEVDSALMLWANYHADGETLTIGFENGSIYDYIDVPPEVVEDFKQAADQDDFFNQEIRGKFKFERVN